MCPARSVVLALNGCQGTALEAHEDRPRCLVDLQPDAIDELLPSTLRTVIAFRDVAPPVLSKVAQQGRQRSERVLNEPGLRHLVLYLPRHAIPRTANGVSGLG